MKREKFFIKYPWYMNKPPKWLSWIGKWGWLIYIPLSTASIIVGLSVMQQLK